MPVMIKFASLVYAGNTSVRGEKVYKLLQSKPEPPCFMGDKP
jgi:hypothetical protein